MSTEHSIKGKRPNHNKDVDTLVASITGKSSTCIAFVRDIAKGFTSHITPSKITMVCSITNAVVYSNLHGSLSYHYNADILGEEGHLKLRFTSICKDSNGNKGFVSIVKEHLTEKTGDQTTVGIYACNSDGTLVTADDVSAGKCWYYLSDEDRVASLHLNSLNIIRPTKTRVYHIGNYPMKPFAHLCAVALNEDGTVTEKEDSSKHIEIHFKIDKKYRTYYVRMTEAPKDIDECYIKLIGRTVHITDPDKTAPGRYNVSLAIKKKNVKKSRIGKKQKKGASIKEPEKLYRDHGLELSESSSDEEEEVSAVDAGLLIENSESSSDEEEVPIKRKRKSHKATAALVMKKRYIPHTVKFSM